MDGVQFRAGEGGRRKKMMEPGDLGRKVGGSEQKIIIIEIKPGRRKEGRWVSEKYDPNGTPPEVGGVANSACRCQHHCPVAR
jgi:hypothetical protein